MILCIDIGNSLIKCGAVVANRLLGRDEIETCRFRDHTAMTDFLKRVSGVVLSIERVAISSVVPQATEVVVGTVKKQLGLVAEVIKHQSPLPFRLKVSNPATVGTDRICAAAGALGAKGRNGIIVDAGSAITVDLVRRGEFVGGVILAGPGMVLDSLHTYASQLPPIRLRNVRTCFPRDFDNTKDSMVLGAGLAGIGGIRESVRYLETAGGTRPRKFVTGGQAARLLERLPRTWHYDRDLTLKGIYNIVTGTGPVEP